MLNDIAIITINRELFGKKNYIEKTIESLEFNSSENYDIRLIVGSNDISYLEKYQNKYKLFPMSGQEWKNIENKTVREKSIYNYYRALNLSNKEVLIFEDDITFTKNWDLKLIQAIDQIEKNNLHQYILSLYSPHIETTNFDYPIGVLGSFLFYGTQGMYYPSSLKKQLTEWIYYKGVIENTAPYDELIAQFADKNKIRIIDFKNSLVQHVAYSDSTGLCIHPHVSPSFID